MAKAVVALNVPNKTQNFYPADDQWILTQLPFAASVAIEEGSAVAVQIVTNNVTGNYTKSGVENANGNDIVGIMAEPIVSTDSDYATAGKLKGVFIPRTNTAKSFFSVGAGTFTAADVGKTVEIHSDSKSLAVDTAGKGARIVKYISSSRGQCQFSMPNTETA